MLRKLRTRVKVLSQRVVDPCQRGGVLAAQADLDRACSSTASRSSHAVFGQPLLDRRAPGRRSRAARARPSSARPGRWLDSSSRPDDVGEQDLGAVQVAPGPLDRATAAPSTRPPQERAAGRRMLTCVPEQSLNASQRPFSCRSRSRRRTRRFGHRLGDGDAGEHFRLPGVGLAGSRVAEFLDEGHDAQTRRHSELIRLSQEAESWRSSTSARNWVRYSSV